MDLLIQIVGLLFERAVRTNLLNPLATGLNLVGIKYFFFKFLIPVLHNTLVCTYLRPSYFNDTLILVVLTSAQINPNLIRVNRQICMHVFARV